mmetsp:Transcript_62945/g.165070  ORF Transcript_62945/g.165070 Transcript_62945/m.165070 type:complete len:324 (+) Transcript_62945:391-1362(+)
MNHHARRACAAGPWRSACGHHWLLRSHRGRAPRPDEAPARAPGSAVPSIGGTYQSAGVALGIGRSFIIDIPKAPLPSLYLAHSSRRSDGMPSRIGVDRTSDCARTLLFRRQLLVLPQPSSWAEGLDSHPPDHVGAVALKSPPAACGHVFAVLGRCPPAAARRPVAPNVRLAPAAVVPGRLMPKTLAPPAVRAVPGLSPCASRASGRAFCTSDEADRAVCRKEITMTRKLLVPTARKSPLGAKSKTMLEQCMSLVHTVSPLCTSKTKTFSSDDVAARCLQDGAKRTDWTPPLPSFLLHTLLPDISSTQKTFTPAAAATLRPSIE